MKKKVFIGFIWLACFMPVFSASLPDSHPEEKEEGVTQTATEGETIVDKINRYEPGKGTVRVIQDESVARLIGKPLFVSGVENQVEEPLYIEMPGWRIQVFSGNNQRTSKQEAYQREEAIKIAFPELSTYVGYSAPFWRLKVGDFRTYKEAQEQLNLLKKELPVYGKEMFIVKETILVRDN